MSALIDQISHSLPFFPLVTPGKEIVSPRLPIDTSMDMTPPSRETQMAELKKVHEHLQASNTKLEALIAKPVVPKTKAILLQQEELIEFRGLRGEILIALWPRSMKLFGASLKLDSNPSSGDSAIKLSLFLTEEDK